MNDIETWMWVIWLSVFVLSLIVEAVGTDLVSIWFAAGALVALLISFIPGVTWWIELIVFFVVSLALLLSLRPLVHHFMRRDIQRSNIDEIVHKKGIMVAKIDLLHQGEVKINDVIWTAIGANETDSIPVGATVEILAVSGNKLVVKKISDSKADNSTGR